MKPDVKKILERIFFGEVPKSLSFIDDEATIEAFERQGIAFEMNGRFPEGVISMNYVRFIQDIEEIKRERQLPEQENIDIDDFKHDLAIAMRSTYHEFIGDIQKDTQEKLCLTYFFRLVLTTYERIYRIHIISEQDIFVNELVKLEDYYYQICKEENAKIEEQQRQKHPPFELSSEWPYSQDLLIKLSKELFDDGFIEFPFALLTAFDNNYTGKCDWIKERTTLLFLLWLLVDKGTTDKPSDLIIEMCCKRFTIRGKDTTRKIAMSTSIQKQIEGGGSELKGKFQKLQNMYQDLGFQ